MCTIVELFAEHVYVRMLSKVALLSFKSGFWQRLALKRCCTEALLFLSVVTCVQREFLDLACAHSVCSSPWFAGGLVCSWYLAAVCF